jgi:photosystem II stability/assembly factor-like uncharacterized protein
VLKTMNGGQQWTSVSAGLPPGAVLALAVDPRTPGVVYEGASADGVSKTTDGGGTWAPVNDGLDELSVNVLAASASYPSGLYAGTTHTIVTSGGAVYGSGDQGRTWTAGSSDFTFAGQVSAIAVHPSRPGIVYAGVIASCDACDQGAIERSANGGRTWSDVSVPDAHRNQAPLDLAIDPRHPRTLYDADFLLGVFKSADGGQTWTSAGTGLGGVLVVRLAVGTRPDGLVYGGACASCSSPAPPGGVFRSSNGGRTWAAANGGQEGDDVNDLVVDPADGRTVYAALHDASAATNAVQRTLDGGRTWTDASAGLPAGVAVKALALDPTDPRTLYAGTDGAGVFVSPNGGASWSPLNVGLTDLRITSLAIAPDGATVYAGTSAGGVFGLQVR